ncbi:MAG: ATP-dependent acyl-CoA ligase [Syntrophaceae bacterium]|nr:ATP-dependent acyl-CoA ligase [Syntrophaceae bacterium]
MRIKKLLESRAENYGGEPFIYFRDQIINFATLDQNVNKAANLFRELGVKKGDHVCFLLPNCPEFVYLWFGLAKIGGVMVPLNFNLRGDGLRYIINHSDSKLIVVNERFYDAYAFVEKDLLVIEQKILHNDGAPLPGNFHSLKNLMEKAEEKEPPTIEIKDGDPLGIIYTSGTTGPPKGAVISHFNYINTAQVWVDEILQYRDDDIFFTTLPLFHANAQMYSTMGALCSGRPYVLREKFSASRFWAEIRQYKATVFNYIGGILTILMKQPEREDDNDNPARIAFGGAAPKEIWLDFEKRFNVKIIEGYGATENGAIPLCNPPDNIRVGSIGKPTSFAEVTIWDENNREVPAGQTGEIVVKEKIPYSMFLGYYKQPDKTREAWEGGWFHTGDRGYKDEDGYFYFVDRMKDCIRRRGENISSFDIEKIVNSHPSVLESAAIAVPSELGEDDVKIYIILRPNKELKPEDLIKFCEERMAYFMVPRYVEFLKEFPKTPTDRAQKFELRRRGIANAWDREKAGYRLRREFQK